jgi:transcriptional regulator with XRE-family HTH domain
MPKPCGDKGEKNLISSRLKELRARNGLSQRALANRLQLLGCDMDKNVITRIETNKRYVTDLELRAIVSIFNVSYSFLVEGNENGK